MIKVSVDLGSAKNPLPGFRWLFSYCSLTWRGKVGLWSLYLLIRTLGPSWGLYLPSMGCNICIGIGGRGHTNIQSITLLMMSGSNLSLTTYSLGIMTLIIPQ